MATDSAHRAVSIDRVAAGKFTVGNDRGGRIGTGDADFTPVELLLAAIGGCTSNRRGHPDLPPGRRARHPYPHPACRPRAEPA
jgi:hypothetical protein